ncbi:MAG: hypothetical protein F6K54_09070 [Okeania sp. SIO3B5]|uniref:hypothetical protein n=1 Tax=Okeania sp. SIO3B5 TaxID=2607811 RepID=UPI00140190CF|nr:hypothetical protein [Okeania sp. SIO3B5]NEO53216.1 hypothetical protein [Okeania sp. SIO3B5]
MKIKDLMRRRKGSYDLRNHSRKPSRNEVTLLGFVKNDPDEVDGNRTSQPENGGRLSDGGFPESRNQTPSPDRVNSEVSLADGVGLEGTLSDEDSPAPRNRAGSDGSFLTPPNKPRRANSLPDLRNQSRRANSLPDLRNQSRRASSLPASLDRVSSEDSLPDSVSSEDSFYTALDRTGLEDSLPVIQLDGDPLSEEKSKRITDAYRQSVRQDKAYADEVTGIMLAEKLGIQVEIYYDSDLSLSAIAPNTTQDIDINTLQKQREPWNPRGGKSIRLLVIQNHYEVLKQEGNTYKRVGIKTDGNCLYNALIKATEGEQVADIISQLESIPYPSIGEPNSPKVQGLRNFVADNYSEAQLKNNLTEILATDEKQYLGSRFIQEVDRIVSESDALQDRIGSETTDHNRQRVKQDKAYVPERPDLKTLQNVWELLKQELKGRQQNFLSKETERKDELTIRHGIFSTEQELEDLYKKIQLNRVKLIREPAKIAGGERVGSRKFDEAAERLVRSDVDDKLVRLIALLTDEKSDENQKFRATMMFLQTDDQKKRNILKSRYKLIQGRDLDDDLKTTFGSKQSKSEKASSATLGKVVGKGKGSALQFPVLAQVLETGKISPSIIVAGELGLLYRGITKNRSLNIKSKNDILELVKSYPDEFKALTPSEQPKDDGNNNPVLTAILKNLNNNHPGFFGEVKETIIQARERKANADYLIRLIYRNDLKSRNIEDPEKLQQKILEFTSSFSEEERKRFIESDKKRVSITGKIPKIPSSYEAFWYLLRSHDTRIYKKITNLGYSLSSAWVNYTKNMVAAQGKDEATRRIYELNAFLEYQGSKNLLSRKYQRKSTLEKVLNLLSSEDNWDAEDALEKYSQETNQGDGKQWLKLQLEKVGLSSADIEEVHRQLKLKGAFPGTRLIDESRQMDSYQKLKREITSPRQTLKGAVTSSHTQWPPQKILILAFKKCKLFGLKSCKKLVFWDDYGRKITLTILTPISSLVPISPVSCLLSPVSYPHP